ncbi:MAG TPA: hypothetical protein VN673_09740, partial [Clostridia bacterium]|nr:hypothetical protein [Clostridia bacterium]
LLLCALLGVMVAGQAMAADIRYMSSGDYLDPAGWQGGVIPGIDDTARFNWGNNTVTLAGEAPLLRRFQMGVDESGQLVVNAGGKLTTTGVANSAVGNNPNAGIVGRLTVNEGGEVTVTNVLFVGASATGILTIDGGKVTVTSHLWGGSATPGVGSIYITNGGVLNIGGNIGLGTVNANTPSGGKCSLYVQEGGLLNLTVIDGAGNSIHPNSGLDISGTGKVTIPGDLLGVMSGYTNTGKITAYAGTGSVGMDYDTTTPGKTTLWAIMGEVPPTEVVWNPAANPTGTGKWNEGANWTGSVRPASVTKVIFNVHGAIPCTVTNAAVADYLVMGDNGPGGTLIITNEGRLTTGNQNATILGYTSNAVMTVENGATASFGHQLWIGYFPDSEGTLLINGGTVSVAGTFGLGSQGGKGTVRVNGGTLNLSQWDDASIQFGSVLDLAGTGKVVISGNYQYSVEGFVLAGQITANGGAGNVVVDYNNINVGQTTIYVFGVYHPPAQAVWDPSLNFPDMNGLWNVSTNWTGGLCPSNVTTVMFNVLDAIPCTVTNAAFAKAMRIGLSGPGGTVIITNGGSLTCSGTEEWNSIGMNNTGQLVVENGGSASFANHLWIGFDATAEGTLTMNGGTVSVGQMFGLGWNGGKGTASINGGTLNLTQWSANNPGSIAGASVLNVAGTGKVVINGNYATSVGDFVNTGKITANGGPNVFYAYDAAANKTTISAVPLPAPQQSITTVSVSGGNVSITYQTTQQHTYYIESTPSLSPASWTPVTGSTNAATGDPVTFTAPAGPGPRFYRTVSF